MAKATAICNCKTCGKEFEMTAEKFNRRAADSWEAWAVENCTECKDCYRARTAAEAAEKAAKYALPEIEGVSEKQIAYAQSLRSGFASANSKPIELAKKIAENPEAYEGWETQRDTTVARAIAKELSGYGGSMAFGAVKVAAKLLTETNASKIIDLLR